MLDLRTLGSTIAARRKSQKLSQQTLAGRASLGRSTLNALENGRLGELGFSRITKVLSALGLVLKLEEAGSLRPTLDELRDEDRHD